VWLLANSLRPLNVAGGLSGPKASLPHTSKNLSNLKQPQGPLIMIDELKNISVSSGYKLGLSHRGAIPFVAGSEYKIKECRGGLERKQKLLIDIGEAIRKKDMPHSFGPCMGFEAAAWCNSLPALVAHQLGHDFVGALHALTQDGVPQNIVDDLIRDINAKIITLLQLGELARVELDESWEAMGRDLGGRSSLDEFIDGCLDLVDKTLITVPTGKVASDAPET
jgi:hypothetical protein